MKLKFILSAVALSIAATSAHADCTLDAKTLASSMTKLPPFHIAIKTASAGVESRMVGEVVMPNSFRLAFGNSATVVTPRGAWMLEQGKWKPQSPDVARSMRHVLLSGLTDSMANLKNIQCNPKAAINNKTYKGIAFDTYEKPGDKAPLAHLTFYLNRKNQPLWLITQGHNAKGNSVVVQQFTYDPSIKIEDPK